MGKRFCENFKQTRSSQNESYSRKSQIFFITINKTTNFDDKTILVEKGVVASKSESKVVKIESSVETTQLFDFNFVNSDDISKIINSLYPTKKTSGAIPTILVKLANKKVCKDLANCISECIN